LAKLIAFSAEDLKTASYLAPFFCAHAGQALRQWEEFLNDPRTIFGRHPMDFRLVEIGSFDDQTGVLDACKPHVISAPGALLRKDDSKGSLPRPVGVADIQY